MLENLIKGGVPLKALQIIAVIVGAVLTYRIIRFGVRRYNTRKQEKTGLDNRNKTYSKLMGSSTKLVLGIIAVLWCLDIAGYNIGSIMAGLGLASVVVGFAIQDVVKDILRGISIVGDQFFQIGDVINYKGDQCEVISMGLRTTKVKSIASKNIISIANRHLEEAEIVSFYYFQKVPLPYDLTVYQAEKIVKDIVERVRKNENVDSCRYIGVTDLSESSIDYYIEVLSDPVYRRQVRRDTLRSILLGMEANHVTVPYNQLDVHHVNDEERQREYAELVNTAEFRDFSAKNKGASSDSLFRTEKYTVAYTGSNEEEILDGVEHFTWRMGCTRKEKMQIRLLTEEMISLIANTTSAANIEVTYTEKGRICTVRARMDSELDGDIKDKIEKMAESGKTPKGGNGMIGRLSGVAAKILTSGNHIEGQVWSLKEYIASVRDEDYQGSRKERDLAMEEIEQSIIANLADDVKVKFNQENLVIEAVKNF